MKARHPQDRQSKPDVPTLAPSTSISNDKICLRADQATVLWGSRLRHGREKMQHVARRDRQHLGSASWRNGAHLSLCRDGGRNYTRLLFSNWKTMADPVARLASILEGYTDCAR